MFLFDSCEQIFVWIGKNASPAEKRNGMTYAHVSLNIFIFNNLGHMKTRYMITTVKTCVLGGQKNSLRYDFTYTYVEV